MKLAVKNPVHRLNVALSEAIVLAEPAGLDRTTAHEVFANGAGGAPFVHDEREAFEHPETAPVACGYAERDLSAIAVFLRGDDA